MSRAGLQPGIPIIGAFVLAATVAGSWIAARQKLGADELPFADPAAGTIIIDYPEQGSIFPPEFPAPTFLWRDAGKPPGVWKIDVTFENGQPAIQVTSSGERLRVGEMDPRALAETNQPPKLTPQQAAAWSWTPAAGVWETIKQRSTERAATITITGFRTDDPAHAVSRGTVSFRTSKDPVGAPIFYRDVPLMPAETENGVIRPLAQDGVRLIQWRLRYVGETHSRVLLENIPTCANCHSFSLDGKTMGMDLDGPHNNKGMYTLIATAPEMFIRTSDVIEWSSTKGRLEGKIRVGFMSQVSPDGQYVITTINGAEADDRPSASPASVPVAGSSPAETRPEPRQDPRYGYYVANFKDYRFLQVFYPTRGILCWYSRATGRLHPLPGADDPRYVQTGAFWSPDGKYLVFARAESRDAYPEGAPPALYANDPNETQIRYDLYRIPFNEGRGGRPEPVAGASHNGMSNSFPKVSPDGRWIVFVQARNGQLMRPDGQLYIVPATGGQARRMRSNTPLMNSWHSFSPNGRWMVFSSKSRSPYTQLFLTHLDEDGNDSPAILIENSTAANRAVNIPEFVNIPPGGMRKIDVPAIGFYRLIDSAAELQRKGQYQASAAAWRKVLDVAPNDADAHYNLGMVLFQAGNFDEAILHFQQTIALKPAFVQGRASLGAALSMKGRIEESIIHLRKAVEMDPGYAPLHNNLGTALFQAGNLWEAIEHFKRATELKPEFVQAHTNLGSALAMNGNSAEAIVHLRKALDLDPANALSHYNLGIALSQTGEQEEAIKEWRKALEADPNCAEADFSLGDALYARGRPSEALAHWRSGLRLRPDHLPALSQSAWVLATSVDASIRNGNQAVQLAQRALKLSGGNDPAALDTLAAAYAEAGRFAEAVETLRRALAAPNQAGGHGDAQALKTRLALYQAKTPFRDANPALTRP